MKKSSKKVSKKTATGGIPYLKLLLIAGVGASAYFVWTAYWMRIEVAQLTASATAAANEKSEIAEKLAISTARTLAEFPQSSARPLFHPDRRPIERAKPVVAPVVVPEAPPPPVNQLQLVGVMQTGVNQFRALIRNGTDAAGQWLIVGDQVQGWRLSAIAADGVTMTVARPSSTVPAQQHKLRLLPGPTASAG